MKRATVIQETGAEVETPILAQAIVDISQAMTKLSASGLNRKAIVALIKHNTGIGTGVIETVLTSLEELKRNYCR